MPIDDPRARLQASVQPPPLDHHRPFIDLAASSYKHLLRLPRSFAGKFDLEDARGVRYVDGKPRWSLKSGQRWSLENRPMS